MRACAFLLILCALGAALCACAGPQGGGRVEADNTHGRFEIFRKF